jgi:hypothetical protein
MIRRNDWATMSFSSRTKYRGAIRGAVCHWPGMNFTINSQQDEINLLNGILRSHRAGVYNDIAYNFAFGRYGHVYELRGAEYQSGAHSPLNGTHEAYLFLTSTSEQPPQSMLDTATAFILTRRSQGVGTDLKAHSDTKATACPGDGLRAFVASFGGQSTPPASKPAPKPNPKPKPSTPKAPKYPGVLLRRGSKGTHVRTIQQRLRDRGWRYQGRPIAVDSDFGPITEQVVKWFQADQANWIHAKYKTPKNRIVDGIIGKQSWDALFNAPVT